MVVTGGRTVCTFSGTDGILRQFAFWFYTWPLQLQIKWFVLFLQVTKEIENLTAEKKELAKSLSEVRKKLDASVVENSKRDNLIHDLKEEVKVNFLANQELKTQLETAVEREKTVKSELKKKEKELKTELDKTKVSKISLQFN